MCGASRSLDVLRANVVLPAPIVPTTEIRWYESRLLLGICLNSLERESNVNTFHFHGGEG